MRGWRKHKNSNEESCQPCRDANNSWRKENYNPELNRKTKNKYKQAHPDRVRESLRKSSEKQRQVAQQKTLEKKLLKEQALRDKELARQETLRQAEETRLASKEAHRLQMAINAEQRREDVWKHRVIKKLKHQMAVQSAREKRRAESEARLLEKKAARAIREEAKRQYDNRPIDHGGSYAEYNRCRARDEGSCEECKAVAARYMRDLRAKDPDKFRQRERAWAAANPEAVRDQRRLATNRRERKARENGQVPYTRRSILERDDYNCYLCGEKVDLSAPHQVGQPGWERYPHLDHVIPLSKGGPDAPDNVRTSHASCNIAKGAAILTDLATAL